jgi:hypothetical protein
VRLSRVRGTLAAVALVAMVSLARADAPSDQYDLFNSASVTIADHYTGLVWERAAPSVQYSFSDAANYCQGLSLNGFGNWRVPSYKELLTLVDENPHFEYENGGLVPHAIDPQAFPGTAVGTPYWTSSMYPEDPTQSSAYAVDFRNGQAFQTSTAPTTVLFVRCVR